MKLLTAVLFLVLTASASAADLPNPLLRLRAGQWTLHRVNTLFGAAEQRQTVIAVTDGAGGEDRLVRIRTETSLDGEVVDEREETSTYAKLLAEQSSALDGAENPTTEQCETTAGGVAFSATAVRYMLDGKEYALFLSEDVPLSGVIRLTSAEEAEPVMELLDFGED